MGKKEQILQTLEGQYTGYIPVIPVTTTFAAKQSGKPMGQVMSDPVAYARAMIDCRKKFEYDGLWVNGFGGITSALGGGLKDRFGKISENGESVILNRDALEQLHEVDVKKEVNLDGMRAGIKLMKKLDPEEPIFTIVSCPASTAAVMMDVGNFYINLVKDPEFVREVIWRITKPIVESLELLAEAGVDVIWNPMPTLSGTCISRKLYENICRESNMYFNEQVKKYGMHLVAHACGKWDDRFDLLAGEGNDAMHVSECDFPRVCEKYGAEICMMGDLPSVPVLLFGNAKQVYDYALKNCLDAVPNGSFILSSDCGMPPNVPSENVLAMCRAAKDAAKILKSRGR